jgi:integrase
MDGKTYWLGEYGSMEAQAEYDRVISFLVRTGYPAPSTRSPLIKRETRSPVSAPKQITVKDLITKFTQWSKTYYRHPDGSSTREHQNFLHVTRPLQEMFGGCPIAEFGPAKLLLFRDELIKRDLARNTINAMLRRLKQIVRWGVPRELVPIDVHSRLLTVEPLQPNRGGKETSGSRGSVEWSLVQQVLPHLPKLLQAFCTVAYFSGARVGELSKLTTRMLDRTQEVWVASLSEHKNRHKGKSRRIFFGPRAQAALLPWLMPDDPDAVIFSPRRVDERQEKRQGKRLPGIIYSRCGLSQCLKRAIARAAVPSFTLAQLRHSCAVKITNSCGIEATRQVLGHSSVEMSRHYAQDADQAAREAAKTIG